MACHHSWRVTRICPKHNCRVQITPHHHYPSTYGMPHFWHAISLCNLISALTWHKSLWSGRAISHAQLNTTQEPHTPYPPHAGHHIPSPIGLPRLSLCLRHYRFTLHRVLHRLFDPDLHLRFSLSQQSRGHSSHLRRHLTTAASTPPPLRGERPLYYFMLCRCNDLRKPYIFSKFHVRFGD
jgi:hypothetical protein